MLLVSRRSLAGICAAGALALAAGCGGDDGSDALSADEFRTQADAICQTSKDAISALDEPTSASTGEEVSAFLAAGLEATDAEIADLRELTGPSDLQGTLDEALDLLDQRQDRIRAIADRIQAGEAVQTVYEDASDEVDSLNDQADAKARELGLTVCGTEGDDASESATTSVETTVTAPDTDTTGGAESPQVETDLQAVRSTLLNVGETLQSASGGSLDEVQALVPDARSQLAEFDDAIAKLAEGTSPDAAQERTRAAVAAAGPAVSQVLSRFLDEIEDGDESGVQSLLPEVQSALIQLQTALAG
jgi:hypothetical protein